MPTRLALRVLAPSLSALVAACDGLPQLPHRPEPIPYADTLPIRRPAPREPDETAPLLKAAVGGELGRAFSSRRLLGAEHEAVNLTHFDDVVNSAWFEHRIDRGDLTPAQVAKGGTTTGPDTGRALTVIGGKAQGISPGFTVRDASGQTFLFKFDPKGNLHLASAAGVISSRLFYAAGYHTPEDFIVVFDSARLVLDPEAELSTDSEERPMTEEDIETVLALTDPLPDGRFLALASKYLPGRPLGPFRFSGTRSDDPNDYYSHEHRRELRGLYVVSAWLNHVDMRFANTLDAFIDPPGYVRHHLIDFAATLGSGTIRPHQPREGSEYNFDLWASMGRMVTLGFYERGWEDEPYEEFHHSIGWMPVAEFDPGGWRPNWPNAAFSRMTAADAYWGAKLVGAFTDEQIAATVAEGQLPEGVDPLLTEILIRRRDKTVSYWYARVTPLEEVSAGTVPGERPAIELSLDDLGIAAGVWEPGATRYRWSFEDPISGVTARGEGAARGAGERQTLRLDLSRLPGRAARPGRDLAVLRVTAVRPQANGRPATIFLRWEGPETGYRVAGLQH